MCGSNSSDAADAYYEEQQRQESERQAKIAESLGVIRTNFDETAREPIYGDVYNDALSLYTNQLQQQYQDAMAQARVNSARSGQSGGSAGAQGFADIQRVYQQGLADVQQRAQNIREQLFSADQQTKGSLIQQTYGGLGATDAQDIALSALRSNQGNILSQARSDNIGDLFSNVATFYNANQSGKGRSAAQDDSSTYFANSGGGYGGNVTN